MKKNKVTSVSLKTLAIKARVYNQIRTDLYNKKLETISESEKDSLFEKWFGLNKEAHNELNDYKSKRKNKAAIELAREKRKAA